MCPVGERWRRSVSEEVLLCERSCQDIYSPPTNCSHSAEGCVCQEGLYRNTEGVCVIPALCPCHDQGMLWEVCIHTHTHTHTHTHWLTPKQDICCPANLVACPHCAWIIVAFIWILPLACCLRPLPSPPLCYLLIKKGLLEDDWHAPRATLHHNAFSLINYEGSAVERRHSGRNLAGLSGIIYYRGDIIGL